MDLKFQNFANYDVGGRWAAGGKKQRQIAKILHEHRNSSVHGVLMCNATARQTIMNSRKCIENNPHFSFKF
jgi:hypothetical protein